MYDFGEIKSNSHASKAKENEKPPKEKVEKVIEGDVVKVKKKSALKKFVEIFFAEDLDHVKNYILTDVIVPAIKNTLLDSIKNGSEMWLWGDAKSGLSSKSNTPYHKISKLVSSPMTVSTTSRQPTYTATLADDSEIILETREEAETVLEHLIALVDEYGSASVADLYDLIGKTPQFTDNKFGWTKLGSASTQRVREGYKLKLPRAEALVD